MFIESNNITSGYSDLFGIEGLHGISSLFDDIKIQTIVNKYLLAKDIINFQDEMIKAGYESYL